MIKVDITDNEAKMEPIPRSDSLAADGNDDEEGWEDIPEQLNEDEEEDLEEDVDDDDYYDYDYDSQEEEEEEDALMRYALQGRGFSYTQEQTFNSKRKWLEIAIRKKPILLWHLSSSNLADRL